MTRYLVERSRDEFEGVDADEVRIGFGGTLQFFKGSAFDHQLFLAYPAGQWLSVVEDED